MRFAPLQYEVDQWGLEQNEHEQNLPLNFFVKISSNDDNTKRTQELYKLHKINMLNQIILFCIDLQ